MEQTKAKPFAIYCLTRGYEKGQRHLYKMLVVRNFFLSAFLMLTWQWKRTDLIIFHEGNVSSADQSVLRFLSPLPLIFWDISSIFKPLPGQSLPEHGESLGYSLMCRFQYLDVWPLLAEYSKVMRVDEDVILLSAPRLTSNQIFQTGLQTSETHVRTNQTLPVLLEELGILDAYDHKFPYTNVFISAPEFWLNEKVRTLTRTIGQSRDALLNRWGDLPVMGVILKHSGHWPERSGPVSKKFSYFHYSHLTFVCFAREIRMFAKK